MDTEPFPRMTVANLIAVLREQPQDAEVVIQVIAEPDVHDAKLTGAVGSTTNGLFTAIAAYLTKIDYPRASTEPSADRVPTSSPDAADIVPVGSNQSDSNLHTVVLLEERIGEDWRFLSASVNSSGNLVLEGHDLGPTVKQFWPDDEYEYWRQVDSANVPKVLLELIKDRFKSEGEFAQWLKTKEIESEFHNWV